MAILILIATILLPPVGIGLAIAGSVQLMAQIHACT